MRRAGLLAATDQQLALAAEPRDSMRAGERLFRVDLAAVQSVAPEQNGPARPRRRRPRSPARAIMTQPSRSWPSWRAPHRTAPRCSSCAADWPCSPAGHRRRRAFEAAQQARRRACWRKLAFAQWQAGQRATSQATLEAWLARSRRSRDPADLADLHLAAGRTAAARQLLTRVIAARPDEVAALNNLAWVLLDEGQAAAARPFAERALRLAPDEPSVMDTLACVLTELGELEPAIELLQRAARVENRGPEIEVHLAQALARRGDRERSARHPAPAAGRPDGAGRARAGRGPGPAPRAGG